jgi:serine/threonine-protein kinase HipA
MHSNLVARESEAPGQAHLLELANTFGVKNPEAIIEEVQTAIAD